MTEYFKNGQEAMEDYFEPKVPCREMVTRACVDLSLYDSTTFRTEECPVGECTRHEKQTWTVRYEGHDIILSTQEYVELVHLAYKDIVEADRLSRQYLNRELSKDKSDE